MANDLILRTTVIRLSGRAAVCALVCASVCDLLIAWRYFGDHRSTWHWWYWESRCSGWKIGISDVHRNLMNSTASESLKGFEPNWHTNTSHSQATNSLRFQGHAFKGQGHTNVYPTETYRSAVWRRLLFSNFCISIAYRLAS